MKSISGLHHITAISSDAQRTVDFYVGTLGLRMVKRTVNFDDPATYHLYFGDTTGSPGTALTFFPWEHIPAGRVGTGVTHSISFSIPVGSLSYWSERMERLDVPFVADDSLRESAISFTDPDGMIIRLVEVANDMRTGWKNGAIPDRHVIRGFHSVLIDVDNAEASARIISDALGMRSVFIDHGVIRLESGIGGSGTYLDITDHAKSPGAMGAGSVHHIAFAVADEKTQLAVRDRAISAKLAPTGVIDRKYFRSVYFREPGGVLFELATMEPGFTVDEPEATLGETLMLPPWLESRRDEIEHHLPTLDLPVAIPRTPEGVIGSPRSVHGNRPVERRGADMDAAEGLMIMIHGRGSSARDIITLSERINGDRLAFIAPEAANGSWYPEPYSVPVRRNEPHRTDAIDMIHDIVESALAKGIDRKNIFILGFSQGACLALDYAMEHPGRLGGIFALSGALMGLGGSHREVRGDMDMEETPVYVAVSDPDEYIDTEHVKRTGSIMSHMNAEVIMRVYANMGHRITDDEIAEINGIICGRIECATEAGGAG